MSAAKRTSTHVEAKGDDGRRQVTVGERVNSGIRKRRKDQRQPQLRWLSKRQIARRQKETTADVE